MKLKIILPIIGIMLVGVVTLIFLHGDSNINIPPLPYNDSGNKIPCPEISFSLDNRPWFSKLFHFVSPAFATKTSSPIQSKLCLLEKPVLNKPVTLLYKFKSLIPAPNTTAKIELPQSFVLVSGSLEWQGDLSQNEEQSFEVVVKSTKVGYYQLKASVIHEGEGSKFGDGDIIDIEITPNDVLLDSKPENNWYHSTQGQAIPVARNNESINSQLIISNKPELNKEFTVTYRVTPQIDLPDPERTQMNLVFPPKAFKVVGVEFPQGGQTHKSDTQLTWKGSIRTNQTVEIQATFRVINTGSGSVYGNLSVQQGGSITQPIQDAKVAVMYVDKYGSNFVIK